MGKTGKASIIFDKDIYIVEKASVVGQKEGEGPLGKYFDNIVNDPFVGKIHGKRRKVNFRNSLCRLS